MPSFVFSLCFSVLRFRRRTTVLLDNDDVCLSAKDLLHIRVPRRDIDGLDDQRCKQIIMMDTTSGKVLGRVTLRPPL